MSGAWTCLSSLFLFTHSPEGCSVECGQVLREAFPTSDYGFALSLPMNIKLVFFLNRSFAAGDTDRKTFGGNLKFLAKPPGRSPSPTCRKTTESRRALCTSSRRHSKH
ncbi:hypothetical protein ACFXTH_007123 [Malus domestica]